jgi:hypothetical protein
MKYSNYILLILFVFIASSCKVEELISELENSKITAKEKLSDVLNAARSDFSSDAQLASIYGFNVNTQGEVDLQKVESAFVYAVQSDSMQANEFYVPVFGSAPVRSPINFDTIISFVRDTTARDILSAAFGKLSDIHIDESLSYDDSPEALALLLNRNDVTTFRLNYPDYKIDMILMPSKSIDTTIVNSADWVVNFHSQSTSLVLWINSASGNIKNLGEL